MKNIFIFIRRYFNFLLFVVLQIVSLTFLVRYNKTQEALYANVANEVIGRINDKYNTVQYYFQLKETNKQLSEENAMLRNMLKSNFEGPDSTRIELKDSLVVDTSGHPRKFTWLPAKVVSNTISSKTNYLTLHRGALQGVKKNMAVIGPSGIVGSVIDVSDNYCRVMSVLHINSKVSSMLKKNNVSGSVEWDGISPQCLTLRNIPKSIEVKRGDSIVTSTYSANFPSHIMVGTVWTISEDATNSTFTIRLKTATNFSSIQYVNLVENIQWDEQRRLEAAPLKNQ